MSSGHLLDTSAAILVRDDPGSDARLLELERLPTLSVVTRVELEGGLGGDPTVAARRRVKLDEMIALFEVLAFDGSCADAYRSIITSCGFSRRKIADRMIAATAIAHDLALITANPDDFHDIPALELIAW